jgi:uncharacterized protein (TIGR03086 family)
MTRETGGYQRALDLFEGVVLSVPRDAWELPSPCAGWTARDLLGHVIDGQLEIIALAEGGRPPDAVADPGSLAGADPVASWRRARAACAAALTPRALATLIPFGGFGELPLRDLLDTYVLELLVHAWDLARAAGLPVRLDADLVHRASATAQVIGAGMREQGLIGPALTPPRGSGELTRLLAFLGRDESAFPEAAAQSRESRDGREAAPQTRESGDGREAKERPEAQEEGPA